MCSSYKAFGATGIVTSGAGRDLDQVRALKFSAFTGGTICSHAYCHILHLGLPVHVGGLTVREGDLLHGDANGVARVPLEIANEIPDVAEEFVAAERIVLDYCRASDNKLVDEWVRRRKEFSAKVTALASRVSRNSNK
jgi:regulator of RNase E activity RraA